MLMKSKYMHRTHSIFQWFLAIFTVISLLFCLALLPIYIYLQNTFTDLQLEKSRQKLSAGTAEIESAVKGTINISISLANDPRFTSLRYEAVDYTEIPVNTRNQMKSAFSNLTCPLDAAFHTALQLDQNVVITDTTVFFEDRTCYYPDFFCVNDLSYTEWKALLAEHSTGFLPVCRVKTYSKEYEALIFATKWTNSTYLYACMEVSELKKLLLAESDINECWFTLTNMAGDLLYSDLPEEAADCQTLDEIVSTGNLRISVHIPNSIFYRDMQPLYLFLILYGTACVIMLILIIVLGTRISAKPVLDIIEILERSRHIPVTDAAKPVLQGRRERNLRSGFTYISDSIVSADQYLEEYQNMVLTQQKVLQARFLEKAINGQLVSSRDIQQFHAYFPDFPEHFCLLLLRIWTYAENAPYTDPMLLVQPFLKSELPNAYQQQFSDTELLLLISEQDFEKYRAILDFLVKNINQEEPAYFTSCVASRIYHHEEDLPIAYRQIQDMERLTFPDGQNRVCTMADRAETSSLPVSMTEFMTLYTAVSHGNREMALSRLSACNREVGCVQNSSLKRSVYGMLRSILTYIRMEHSLLLLEQHIPDYRADKSLCEQLAGTVETFCDLIRDDSREEMNTFTRELFQYIDSHYTDADLCITSLETQFKCSESTIRKAFKSVTDVTISRYIEQKRMNLANELLAQKQKTITEIALECGFANLNSFYKAYRRVFGHAPTMQGAEK